MRPHDDSQHLAEPGRTQKPGPIRRLYDWTVHWAATPYACWALFLLAFAEASFFPIPPDVLLIAMCLAAPKRSLRYALICTVGSVVGGVLGFYIGRFAMAAVGRPILEFYHVTERFDQLTVAFGDHGFLYVFVAALTPIPYKVFTIAAGAAWPEVTLGVVIAASVVGRGLRFFAVAALFFAFGPRIKRFIDRYFNLLTILFCVLLALGFVCVTIFYGHEQNDGNTDVEAPGAAVPAADSASGLSRTGETPMLSEKARQTLLDIARKSVEAAVTGRVTPKFEVDDPELQGHQGAFVTLKTHGQLRGCIGNFVAQQPLWQVVREMADAAATRDVRFLGNQLMPAELAELHIEISVLSPLRRVQDPINEVELGKHGIYVRKGTRGGCFLPQVATETGWSKEEFLSRCCGGKAGLPPDAWKDPQTEVQVFTAEVFD